MAPSLFEEVPRDERAWQSAAAAAGVANKTLQSYDNFKSASKVTKPQFLLYRTIFVKKAPTEFDPNVFGLGTEITNARTLLRRSRGFQSYITAIRTNSFGGMRQFTALREQQREVLECQSGTGSILTQKDESPVNATFINMLQAIGTVAPTIRARWRHTKIELTANFGHGRSFTAITDGQLQDIQTGKIRALVECKREVRVKHSMKTDMQEASQIVALMRHFPSGTLLRYLFSEDDDDLYFTIAEPNRQYLKYLNQGQTTPRSFMKMHQFGPWGLKNAAEIEHLAAIILAISL